MGHRWFTIRPPLTLRGRKFKGLRGWAGKPFHPPLTDVPVTAYTFAAVFDLASIIFGEGRLGRQAYIAATWSIIAGAIVSLPTILTGFWDWLKSTPKYTQARRTANTHMAIMLTVTALVAVDVLLRLQDSAAPVVPVPVLALSLVIGALVFVGATYGGSLVYDYGFNVETSGDHPVWHESEVDVVPGDPGHPA